MEKVAIRAGDTSLIQLAVFIMLMGVSCKGCEFANVELRRRALEVDGCECPVEEAP